jgi:hypothetical protein
MPGFGSSYLFLTLDTFLSLYLLRVLATFFLTLPIFFWILPLFLDPAILSLCYLSLTLALFPTFTTFSWLLLSFSWLLLFFRLLLPFLDSCYLFPDSCSFPESCHLLLTLNNFPNYCYLFLALSPFSPSFPLLDQNSSTMYYFFSYLFQAVACPACTDVLWLRLLLLMAPRSGSGSRKKPRRITAQDFHG